MRCALHVKWRGVREENMSYHPFSQRYCPSIHVVNGTVQLMKSYRPRNHMRSRAKVAVVVVVVRLGNRPLASNVYWQTQSSNDEKKRKTDRCLFSSQTSFPFFAERGGRMASSTNARDSPKATPCIHQIRAIHLWS